MFWLNHLNGSHHHQVTRDLNPPTHSLTHSLSLSLSPRPNHPSLSASLPNCILCPSRAVVSKFLLVGQHWHEHVMGSIGECHLWVHLCYRNAKVKVRSPDGDTEYFDIVAGVLQGDTLAPYLFIICLDYVLRTSIDKIRENGFELTKKRRRRYPAKTISTPATRMT